MQPDAAGLAFATGVLAVVIAAFGLASRLISGAVAGLSYAVGWAVARGIADWAAPDPDHCSPSAGGPHRLPPGWGDDGDRVDGDAPDAPGRVLARVVGGRPRLRIECRPRDAL